MARRRRWADAAAALAASLAVAACGSGHPGASGGSPAAGSGGSGAGGTTTPGAGSGAGGRTTPVATIPRALIAGRRPIGVGPRFQSKATGPVVGRCSRTLGPRRGVHIEVFAQNEVVLLPAGIGTTAPRTSTNGRISGARCFGALVTVDPTGIVLLRPGARLTLAAVFRSWGQPLTRTRLAGFRAAPGAAVAVYVGGRQWTGAPGAVPLRAHAEIVLEVGPHVPPHHTFSFPPGT